MMLWMILTAMAAAAAVLVAAPFLRRPVVGEGASSRGLVVFRDQLQEVEREARDELIDPVEAEAARQEIMRRALVCDRAAATTPAVSATASGNTVVIAVCAIVVLGSVGLYSLNGRPDLHNGAHAPRAGGSGGLLAVLKAEGEQQAGSRDAGSTPAALATVDEMIDRLNLRLKLQPDDPEGWRMLGWSNTSIERYSEAVDAYAKAVALAPSMPDLQSAYGEAIVRANGGTVTAQADEAFEKALRLDPKDQRTRYFQGLSKLQRGEKTTALEMWTALLNDAGPADDWSAALEVEVADLGRELGIVPSIRTRHAAAPASSDARRETSPSVDQAEEQQARLVRGMVDGLANRLAGAPRDEEGWTKLIRSYTVLGEYNAAKGALLRALDTFPASSPEGARIADSAKGLGIGR